MGLEPGEASRAALVAIELAALDGTADASDVYYTTLLQHVGCTAYAHEAARLLGGDEIAVKRASVQTDFARPREVLRTYLPSLAPSARLASRARRGGHRGGEARARSCRDTAGRTARWRRGPPSGSGLGPGVVGGAPRRLRAVGRQGRSAAAAAARRSRSRRGSRRSPRRPRCSTAWAGGGVALAAVRQRAGAVAGPRVGRAARAPRRRGVWACWTQPGRRGDGGGRRRAPAARDVRPTRGRRARVPRVRRGRRHQDAAAPRSLHRRRGARRRGRRALRTRGRRAVPGGARARPRARVGAQRHLGAPRSAELGRRRSACACTPTTPSACSRAAGRSRRSRALAGTHHERLDGSGYHRAETAAGLGPAARLLAAADVMQAHDRAARAPAGALGRRGRRGPRRRGPRRPARRGRGASGRRSRGRRTAAHPRAAPCGAHRAPGRGAPARRARALRIPRSRASS